MKLGLGIEPGTHWWEVSALTTAPTLLPAKAPQKGSQHFALCWVSILFLKEL